MADGSQSAHIDCCAIDSLRGRIPITTHSLAHAGTGVHSVANRERPEAELYSSPATPPSRTKPDDGAIPEIESVCFRGDRVLTNVGRERRIRWLIFLVTIEPRPAPLRRHWWVKCKIIQPTVDGDGQAG